MAKSTGHGNATRTDAKAARNGRKDRKQVKGKRPAPKDRGQVTGKAARVARLRQKMADAEKNAPPLRKRPAPRKLARGEPAPRVHLSHGDGPRALDRVERAREKMRAAEASAPTKVRTRKGGTPAGPAAESAQSGAADSTAAGTTGA